MTQEMDNIPDSGKIEFSREMWCQFLSEIILLQTHFDVEYEKRNSGGRCRQFLEPLREAIKYVLCSTEEHCHYIDPKIMER